jgi:putative protein kinase ArgK-like GTPase of G3E family
MRGSWFDTIIIETVGVSQSESSTTWSIFLLLKIAVLAMNYKLSANHGNGRCNCNQ